MSLQEKKRELVEKQKQLAQIFATSNNGRDLNADQLADVKSRNTELNGLRGEIKSLEEVEAIRVQNEAELAEAGKAQSNGVQFKDGGQREEALSDLSLGELFVKSAAFSQYSKQYKRGPEATFGVKAVFQETTANSGAVGYAPQILRNGVIVEYPVRKPKMDQLIPTSRVTLPAILYQRETLWTNGAAFVHEDDPTRPESAFKLEDDSELVKKLRVSIPVSDDMMEDASYMIDYVNNRLLTQMALAKDQALINGDGTGDNLKGLLNRTGILTNTVANLGPNVIDAVHRAMTQVLLTSEHDPNCIAMHPLDWEGIRLTKNAVDDYLYGPPTEIGPMRLWGIDIVSTKGMPQHTALLGAYDMACTQAIRRDITMSMSTEDQDNFMRGRLTIKAEMRLALVVYRPSALFALTGL